MTEELDAEWGELADWVFTVMMMGVLCVFGTILNDGVAEYKRLGTDFPAHCVSSWLASCG